VARVLVSIPSFDGRVKSRTAESVANLCCDGHELLFANVSGYDCAMARTKQAEMAVELGADYLLAVDSDMVVPQDALVNLLSHGVALCMGFYTRGTSDCGETNVVVRGCRDLSGCYLCSEIAEMREGGEFLVPDKAAGMGCALVRADVFERVRPPWFQFTRYGDGSWLGEDYFFCEKCRQAGITPHIDTRVGCGHIHDRVLEAI